MHDLVEFMNARIDEDERGAREAFSSQFDPENGWGTRHYEGDRQTIITPHVGIAHEAVQADHIARHDPARVLREVEAKRKILNAAVVAWNSSCDPTDTFWPQLAPTLKAIVTTLAQPYSDHPDYKQEWSRNA